VKSLPEEIIQTSFFSFFWVGVCRWSHELFFRALFFYHLCPYFDPPFPSMADRIKADVKLWYIEAIRLVKRFPDNSRASRIVKVAPFVYIRKPEACQAIQYFSDIVFN